MAPIATTYKDVYKRQPIHWHEELEIILPSVPGCLEIDGNRFPFQEGDIMFVNPYELHATRIHRPGQVCHMLLRSDCFQFLHDTAFFSTGRKLTEGELSFPTLITADDPANRALLPPILQMAAMKPPSDEEMCIRDRKGSVPWPLWKQWNNLSGLAFR